VRGAAPPARCWRVAVVHHSYQICCPVAADDDVFQVRESLPREGRCYDLVWLLDAALAQPRIIRWTESRTHGVVSGGATAVHCKGRGHFLP
jgi:hypothetical protein